MSEARGAVVLLYHRVTRLSRDPQLLCVSPAHFCQHIEILRRVCPVIPMSVISESLRAGAAVETGAAITFDDGYRDNLLEAAPILRSTGTPATIFSTTGRDERAGEFFWDEMDRIFLSPGRLPRQLSLGTSALQVQMDLGAFADYTDAQAEAHRDWNVLQTDDPTPRQRAYREFCIRLHALTVSDRAAALQALRQWAGFHPGVRETHRMMSWDDLQEESRSSSIEFGGHTVDHPRLSSEAAVAQRQQMTTNHQAITSATGRAPRGFAYPFGTRRDYTAETISLVKECGFEFACSNFPGRVVGNTDPHQIPRYIVRDWTGEEFERRLCSWLGN